MKCLTPGCTRTRRPDFAHCDDCTRRLLRGMYAPTPEPRKPEWLRRASFNRDLTAA